MSRFLVLLLLTAASYGNALREETSRSIFSALIYIFFDVIPFISDNHISHKTFVGNCKDTANGAKDGANDGCEWYDKYPKDCGKYDDNDFKSNNMCCACGGIFSFQNYSFM